MSIIKFDTTIYSDQLSYKKENTDIIEIIYSNETLILETCLLSVQKINKESSSLTIECSFNERSENNKLFLNKILLLEEKLRTFSDKSFVSCIYRTENIYYIKFNINKDTLFFNKHKKQVTIDSIYVNAIVKCLIEINYLNIIDDTVSYSIKLKQVLIGNSF